MERKGGQQERRIREGRKGREGGEGGRNKRKRGKEREWKGGRDTRLLPMWYEAQDQAAGTYAHLVVHTHVSWCSKY